MVVECLPTNPNDHVVAINEVRVGKDDVRMDMVFAPNKEDLTTTYIVDADSFPALIGQRLTEDRLSWLRMDFAKPWMRQCGRLQTNIRAELSVFTYWRHRLIEAVVLVWPTIICLRLPALKRP